MTIYRSLTLTLQTTKIEEIYAYYSSDADGKDMIEEAEEGQTVYLNTIVRPTTILFVRMHVKWWDGTEDTSYGLDLTTEESNRFIFQFIMPNSDVTNVVVAEYEQKV